MKTTEKEKRCLTDDEILLYIKGSPEEGYDDRIEEHLEGCQKCWNRYHKTLFDFVE